MAQYSMRDKAYQLNDGTGLSMTDMLGYFHKHGVMRVSDLHVKIGVPPAYRIDGDLVYMHGPAVDDKTAKRLIFPLRKDWSEKYATAANKNKI